MRDVLVYVPMRNIALALLMLLYAVIPARAVAMAMSSMALRSWWYW